MSEDRDMFDAIDKIVSDGGGEVTSRLFDVMRGAIVFSNDHPSVHTSKMHMFWSAVTRYAPSLLRLISKNIVDIGKMFDSSRWQEWCTEQARTLLEEADWDLDNAREGVDGVVSGSELWMYHHEQYKFLAYLFLFDHEEITKALDYVDEMGGGGAEFAWLFFNPYDRQNAYRRHRQNRYDPDYNPFRGLNYGVENFSMNLCGYILNRWLELDLYKIHGDEAPGEEDGEDEDEEEDDGDQGDDWEAEEVVPDDMSAFLSARGLIQPTGESDGQDE